LFALPHFRYLFGAIFNAETQEAQREKKRERRRDYVDRITL